jgi:hypothetical protein
MAHSVVGDTYMVSPAKGKRLPSLAAIWKAGRAEFKPG